MEKENILIGRNTVREAIKSGRSIDAVFVAKDSRDGSLREILALAKKQGIVVKETVKSKLDELSMPFGYQGRPGNHQGIVAQVSSIVYAELEDIFKRAEEKGEPPFLVALDGITDPQNLGAIVRSAEVLGAHGVIIAKRRNAPLSAAAMKAACGACEYLPVAKVTNLNQTLEILKEQGIFVASAVMGGTEISKVNLKGAMCIVIGGEDEGVSQNIVKNSDFQVGIPMMGNINSLNASCAAAVIIYEKIRQDREGK